MVITKFYQAAGHKEALGAVSMINTPPGGEAGYLVTESTTVLMVMPVYVSVFVATISQQCGKGGHLHTGLCYFWRRPEYGAVCP